MISFPEILLRLVVSLILGALIGWEREYSEHNTGIRTNALIALAQPCSQLFLAMLSMISPRYHMSNSIQRVSLPILLLVLDF
ncbi:hypothetical protein KDW_55450 [Dictyobacter vulcani]|uniref:MgtC/SapB/SrpB/YhiD N-terminal domain-containing protein n=1 Tax=Dictyobacter vulcani TaxID=2607529 RepID=A0A5J4KUW3_9CHLR|nr:hypothetical protein KDW_55450 [Dictyobacter vulcani]